MEAYGSGRATEALSHLDRIKKEDMPEEGRVVYLGLRIAALESAERSYDAKKVVEKVIGDKSSSLKLLSHVGDMLMDLGEFEHGIALFQETARRDPSEPGTHYNIALAMRAKGDLDNAIAMFRKSVEVDDTFYPAWAEMSQTYFSMQQVDDAAETMRKYLELKPDDYVNWTVMGVIESMLEDYERAEEAFDRAAEIEPNYSELWYNRAMTAHRRQNIDQVRYCHERLADVAGESWEEAIIRASIHHEDKEPWMMWEAIEDAVERGDERFQESPQQFHKSLTHIYATALEMMADSDMREQLEHLRERAIARRLFDERVFSALRKFNGEPLKQAQMYSVLIAATANEMLKEMYSGPNTPGPAGYCRVYGVIATDEVEARAIVADFEERVGEAAESTVKDVRLVNSKIEDERVGIASVRGIYFHSEDDIGAAIEQMAESLADELQLPDEDEQK